MINLVHNSIAIELVVLGAIVEWIVVSWIVWRCIDRPRQELAKRLFTQLKDAVLPASWRRTPSGSAPLVLSRDNDLSR